MLAAKPNDVFGRSIETYMLDLLAETFCFRRVDVDTSRFWRVATDHGLRGNDEHSMFRIEQINETRA